MMSWIQQLAPRERLILGCGAVAAIAIIVWGLLWKPLHDGRTQLADQVDQKSNLYIDVQRAMSVDGQDTDNPAPGGAGQSILILIDTSARSYGLAESFTQTRPNGPNEISVSFQRAPFDTIVSWLIELESTYGIAVNSVSMTDSGQPGLINGQVFLARS